MNWPRFTYKSLAPKLMRPLFWIGTFLLALVISLVALVLLLPLGLIAVERISFPLALGVAALLTAVVASWAGNFLAGDQTRTQILKVVGVTELVAAVIVLVVLLSPASAALFGPLIYIGLLSALLLAVGATVATAVFRTTNQQPTHERRLTLVLLILAILSVPVVIAIASLFGLTGA